MYCNAQCALLRAAPRPVGRDTHAGTDKGTFRVDVSVVHTLRTCAERDGSQATNCQLVSNGANLTVPQNQPCDAQWRLNMLQKC